MNVRFHSDKYTVESEELSALHYKKVITQYRVDTLMSVF